MDEISSALRKEPARAGPVSGLGVNGYTPTSVVCVCTYLLSYKPVTHPSSRQHNTASASYNLAASLAAPTSRDAFKKRKQHAR